MITPTVGRHVWFYPRGLAQVKEDGAQPCSAEIAFVHNDREINIGYLDNDGVHYNATNVPLLDEHDEAPAFGGFCVWMPYQKGQEARTTEAVREFDARVSAELRTVFADIDSYVDGRLATAIAAHEAARENERKAALVRLKAGEAVLVERPDGKGFDIEDRPAR